MSELAERIEWARRAYVAALGTPGEEAAKRHLEAQIHAAKRVQWERR
jgi:hypothetical protein